MAGNIKVYKDINSITKAFPVEFGKKRMGIFAAEKKENISDFDVAKAEGLDFALIKTVDYKKMVLTIEKLSHTVIDMKATIDRKQAEIEAEKLRVENEVQRLKKELLEDNELYRATLQENCDKKDDEIRKFKEQIENIGKINDSLLAQNKKRSNQDRHLQPKREHTGYVILESAETDYKYPYYEEYEVTGFNDDYSPIYRKLQKPKKIMCTTKIWMTKIQTPYSVEMDFKLAKYQITKDLLKDIDTDEGKRLLGRCGIEKFVLSGYEDITDKSKNTVFSLKLKKNYRAGYYEATVLHTKDLDDVPTDMLFQRKKNKTAL